MMQRGKHMKYTLDLLDNMEGHEFEYAVADLLRHNVFVKFKSRLIGFIASCSSFWESVNSCNFPY